MDDDRIRFPAGKQTEFIDNVIIKTGGVTAIAATLKVSTRTIRDWRQEKFTMSYETLKTMSHLYKIPIPKNIQHEKKFWYVTKGARQGGLASYKKQGGAIGDPVVRAQKWREWWEKEGKRKTMPANFYPLPFTRAEKSVELAEFIGIMMGDGGMTNRQLIITLNHITDLAYSRFVVRLIKKLFHITPAVYHVPRNSVNNIVISRSGLITYLHSLGLPIGHKIRQNLDMPDWIKENSDYTIACIRGLVDTDGSVFTSRYKVNGKQYSYKKISFCSASPALVKTVREFLQNRGLHIRVKQGRDIRIESVADVARYMRGIGSHNPKHWKRYRAVV
jgi:hypothetical protein